MTTYNIVVVSDMHVGSTVGLWHPNAVIEDGGESRLNPVQDWLWHCWQAMLRDVAEITPSPIIIINGDTVQGAQRQDAQLMTDKAALQALAAIKLLEPLRALTKKLYLIRGTPYHDGDSGANVEVVGEMLNAERDANTKLCNRWELYLDVGGPVVHFQHSIGTSRLLTMQATVPLRDVVLEMADLVRNFGAQAPNLRVSVCSHRHLYVSVNIAPDIHAVVTPGWQMHTSFTHKNGSRVLPDIGWIWLSYDGKDWTIRPRIYPAIRPQVERM